MGLVLIVGAGASVAPPAELPLFGPLRGDLLDQLEIHGSLRTLAAELAPETFMRAIYDGQLPLENWLSDTLGRGAPNAVHHVLATALQEGATVWTVNIDELIEQAVADQGAPPVTASAFPDETPRDDSRLLKTHGTLGRGEYVFRAEQVVQPLTTPWARRLRDDLDGASVVVIGYAGLDVDLRLILAQAFEKATSVTWFETDDKRDDLLTRFPALGSRPLTLAGTADATALTDKFLIWADDRGLTRSVPPHLRSDATRSPNPTIPRLKGSKHLAGAFIAERCGATTRARRGYRITMLARPWTRSARIAGSRLLKLALYQPTRAARVVFRLAPTPLGKALPTRAARYLDRVEVTLLSSHEGRHEAAIERAARATDPDDPSLLLAQAKAARFAGRMDDALDLAQRARVLTEAQHSIDETAHAAFEIAFDHTWCGRFPEAETAVRGSAGGLDTLASVRWIAWAEWQTGCLSIYRNCPTEALMHVRRSRELFKADGLAAGEVACVTVSMTAHRMLADEAGFDRCRAELEALRGGRGWTDYTDLSISYELAEWHRTHAVLHEARELLIRLRHRSANRPIHMALALLGLAELNRTEHEDSSAEVTEAREIAYRHGFGYLSAHVEIADYLASRQTSDEAMSAIRKLAIQLATRDGTLASDPGDFCLGQHPTSHELFLP